MPTFPCAGTPADIRPWLRAILSIDGMQLIARRIYDKPSPIYVDLKDIDAWPDQFAMDGAQAFHPSYSIYPPCFSGPHPRDDGSVWYALRRNVGGPSIDFDISKVFYKGGLAYLSGGWISAVSRFQVDALSLYQKTPPAMMTMYRKIKRMIMATSVEVTLTNGYRIHHGPDAIARHAAGTLQLDPP